MIDIGVNLTNSQFKNDIEQVINNALSAGVQAMIVTGTSIEQSRMAQQLAMQYPASLYCTAGIHPHDANTYGPQSLAQLRQLSSLGHVLAIGECGLDFNRNFSTPKQQLFCFEAQLELAVELQLPVFLHQREAHKDFLRLIKKYRAHLTAAVAHCFTGGKNELLAYLEADLHIGITGWLCDERRGKELQDCVSLIPANRLMVETDAPYLFPRSLKLNDSHLTAKQKKKARSRNEPCYLAHIVQTLAQLRGDNVAELNHLILKNSQSFFKLSDKPINS